LGPDNGGIIINLGIDGVACQTAKKLTARKNSTLNVRLRGSGLDVNLVGEIIWQGASQKEIGISFKDLPASQQQVIADWIARQEQASKAPPLDDFPPPKPMPAMPEVFAPGVGYVPLHFLSHKRSLWTLLRVQWRARSIHTCRLRWIPQAVYPHPRRGWK
jgi:hypothetical protein